MACGRRGCVGRLMFSMCTRPSLDQRYCICGIDRPTGLIAKPPALTVAAIVCDWFSAGAECLQVL
jgi:hypothetical protein